MTAKELISNKIPALTPEDTGHRALNLMEIFKLSHLPIVIDNELRGIISDNEINKTNLLNNKIRDYSSPLLTDFIYEDQHVYEIIEKVNNTKLSLIPVLDKQKKYIGAITLLDLIEFFGNTETIRTQGALIVIEINANSYSLTQIANIIEGNGAKILGLHINRIPETNLLEITIKLNTTNLTAIIQTFNRYSYEIKNSFMEDEFTKSVYEDRYESFINYLNL